MANLRIHLPGALDPNGAGSNLSRTLRRKVSEGIVRKVGRNINRLRQLNVTPFDASLKLETKFRDIRFREIEWMDFDKPFGKQLKVKAFDANLRMEIEFREIQFREIEWMNLNAELNFDY